MPRLLNDFASDSFLFEILPHCHHLSQSFLASMCSMPELYALLKNKREKVEFKEGSLQEESQES